MIRLIPTVTPEEAVRELYEASFPLEEKRPWDSLSELLKHDRLRLLTLDKEGVFGGFLFYWQLPDYFFIEYFAVHPDMRGGGTGSHVMRLLEEQTGGIVLEVEPPLTAQAVRRIAFYERLGYQAFPEVYHQPPHHKGFPPLELRLMQKGLTPGETFLQVKNQLYKYVYKQP
ncbi:GNAT family N-acetyltransferase [Chitinophaga sp. Mgbs1]|uniref:GNAT family N-acetyltransferase n=1 Tax=Chitinophaga solisilvae TaxID=1233460 RepID=A0A433WB44_9BACT|nr:GNAT family N-acetyltransferase [Chitinophaga solisilvae]